jgi:hypothetical protein
MVKKILMITNSLFFNRIVTLICYTNLRKVIKEVMAIQYLNELI